MNINLFNGFQSSHENERMKGKWGKQAFKVIRTNGQRMDRRWKRICCWKGSNPCTATAAVVTTFWWRASKDERIEGQMEGCFVVPLHRIEWEIAIFIFSLVLPTPFLCVTMILADTKPWQLNFVIGIEMTTIAARIFSLSPIQPYWIVETFGCLSGIFKCQKLITKRVDFRIFFASWFRHLVWFVPALGLCRSFSTPFRFRFAVPVDNVKASKGQRMQ